MWCEVRCWRKWCGDVCGLNWLFFKDDEIDGTPNKKKMKGHTFSFTVYIFVLIFDVDVIFSMHHSPFGQCFFLNFPRFPEGPTSSSPTLGCGDFDLNLQFPTVTERGPKLDYRRPGCLRWDQRNPGQVYQAQSIWVLGERVHFMFLDLFTVVCEN